MTFPNVVDLVGNVVASCREVGQDAPYYYYGHPLEIVNTLMEKDASDVWRLKKYPAVFLFLKPTTKEQRNNFESEADIDIIIVTDTKPEWKASDRDTNVFVPILIPLYQKLIHALGHTTGMLFRGEHTFIKHYYWGSTQTGANIANDYADAIEIQGAKIKTFASCVDTTALV